MTSKNKSINSTKKQKIANEIKTTDTKIRERKDELRKKIKSIKEPLQVFKPTFNEVKGNIAKPVEKHLLDIIKKLESSLTRYTELQNKLNQQKKAHILRRAKLQKKYKIDMPKVKLNQQSLRLYLLHLTNKTTTYDNLYYKINRKFRHFGINIWPWFDIFNEISYNDQDRGIGFNPTTEDRIDKLSKSKMYTKYSAVVCYYHSKTAKRHLQKYPLSSLVLSRGIHFRWLTNTDADNIIKVYMGKMTRAKGAKLLNSYK